MSAVRRALNPNVSSSSISSTLIWTLIPKNSEQEKQKLLRTLPPLLRALAKGMELVRFDKQDQNQDKQDQKQDQQDQDQNKDKEQQQQQPGRPPGAAS